MRNMRRASEGPQPRRISPNVFAKYFASRKILPSVDGDCQKSLPTPTRREALHG